MTIVKTFSTAVAVSILLLSASLANAGSYNGLVAFGDSLSDTGNITHFLGLPLPPYATGRFSNGPVWIDHLANNLGLSSLASRTGGTNYAWGGATSGPAGGALPPLSLLDQTDEYLTEVAGAANANALYSIWIGGNDVLNADPTTDLVDDIANQAVANVTTAIMDLSAAGAMTFLIPNLPDIGLTPSSAGNPDLASYRSELTSAYNLALSMALGDLSSSLGINIIAFDVAALFAQLTTDPGSFGFSNASDKCWTGNVFGTDGDVCADPDSYVFWDDVHPTAAAHAVLGDLATELVTTTVVPVPAALPLLLSGLGFLGFCRRRRNG